MLKPEVLGNLGSPDAAGALTPPKVELVPPKPPPSPRNRLFAGAIPELGAGVALDAEGASDAIVLFWNKLPPEAPPALPHAGLEGEFLLKSDEAPKPVGLPYILSPVGAALPNNPPPAIIPEDF